MVIVPEILGCSDGPFTGLVIVLVFKPTIAVHLFRLDDARDACLPSKTQGAGFRYVITTGGRAQGTGCKSSCAFTDATPTQQDELNCSTGE